MKLSICTYCGNGVFEEEREDHRSCEEFLNDPKMDKYEVVLDLPFFRTFDLRAQITYNNNSLDIGATFLGQSKMMKLVVDILEAIGDHFRKYTDLNPEAYFEINADQQPVTITGPADAIRPLIRKGILRFKSELEINQIESN